MTEAMPDDYERQAIIVIDNLDRVKPADALKIWATLQTFLQDQNDASESWYSKLWLIVPYDPDGLARLWDNAVISEVGRNSSDVQKTSDSFIDKRVQLRFEVSPLVLSNWKQFLIDLLTKALPEHGEEEMLGVYRVYNRCSGRNHLPTPRELKLFVNQIGAIHRQWKHEYPLEHIAYYVALRRHRISVSDIAQRLLDGSIPEESVRSIKPEDLRKNIAGLVFNVSASLGQQILLATPILKALTDNKPNQVVNLIENHPYGFWPVLDDMLGEGLKDQSPQSLVNIARCLKGPELVEYLEKNEIAVLKTHLSNAATATDTWAPLDEELAEGLGTLVEVVGQEYVSKSILDSIRLNLPKVIESSDGKAEVLYGLQQVTRLITGTHADAWPSKPFEIPGSPEDWIEDCRTLSGFPDDDQLLTHLKPSCDAEEIEAAFLDIINEGHVQNSTVTAVRTTQDSGISPSWDSLVKPTQAQLHHQRNASGEQAAALLELLGALYQFQPGLVNSALNELVNQGHLAHCLHHQESTQHPRFVGWFMATYASVRPDFSSANNLANSQQGYNIMNDLLNKEDRGIAEITFQALQTLDEVKVIWQTLEQRQFSGLFLEVLRVGADNEILEIFALDHIVMHWRNLYEHLPNEQNPERFDDLIKHLTENTDFVTKLIEQTVQFDPQEAGLYQAILNTEAEVEDFFSWCVSGLRNLSKEEWQQHIEENTFLLDVVGELQNSGKRLNIGLKLQDAILGFGKKVINDDIAPPEGIEDYITSLLKALQNKHHRDHLKDRILDLAVNSDGVWSENYLIVFKKQLSDTSILRKNDRVPGQLFSPLVQSQSEWGLMWLAKIATENPKLLGAFTNEAAVEVFKERVVESLDPPPDNPALNESLIQIAKAWKIAPNASI